MPFYYLSLEEAKLYTLNYFFLTYILCSLVKNLDFKQVEAASVLKMRKMLLKLLKASLALSLNTNK
jgi:hypothetical protein